MNRVYYHRNCPDGFTAAWAVWIKQPTWDFVPITYGEKITFPQPERFDDIYFVDFCPTRIELDAFVGLAKVHVLDHHLSAQKALDGWLGGEQLFDMDRSGAGIAWDYFHAGEKRPPIVAYAQDRDLWTWDLPSSRAVSAWMLSYEYDFQRWTVLNSWLGTRLQAVIAEGEAILRTRVRSTKMMCVQTVTCKIGGYDTPTINATDLWSEVGEMLLEQNPSAPFVASYYDSKHGTRVWSLRSRQGEHSFDVSQIATMYGGGGHRNAAGFRTQKPRLIEDVGVTPRQ